MVSLSQFVRGLQASLFPLLEIVAPERVAEHESLILLFELVQIEGFVSCRRERLGRPKTDLKALARCFLAKAAINVADTKSFRKRLVLDSVLLRLCGLSRVPSESVLSRAFSAFASSGLGDQAHEALVKRALGETFSLHISRDAPAISGRERPAQKEKSPKKPKGSPGRKKGVPPKPRVLKRQQVQLGQRWQDAVAALPTRCDTGTKRNSKGHDQHWHGYKLHIDVDECGFPISALTSSASLHDSQVAIPLMRMSAERTRSFYQLMDAGYVGGPIRQAAQDLGQVAIIKPKATKTEPVIPLAPHEDRRYKQRSVVERFFSDLKDNHGGNAIRVRGYAKVHFHLMMGVLAIFALTLIRF